MQTKDIGRVFGRKTANIISDSLQGTRKKKEVEIMMRGEEMIHITGMMS